jgi:putative transposase
MRASKFSVDQIIRILAESELPSNSVSSVIRKYGITQNTFYRWRKMYKGFSSSEAKRLKVLEEENARLKRLLAEKELEIQALSEIVKKNF